MVEQMVSSNLSKYGLGKSPTIITTPDNPPLLPPVATKDKTFKNVQNPEVAAKDTTVNNVQNDNKTGPLERLATTLNNHNDNKTGPLERLATTINNHNLVYARRKSDAIDTCRVFPVNPSVTRIINSENEQSGLVNLPAMEHWNARFAQLQKYLKQCDSSNHEVYLQDLRSFSPDECSRHAVELEKRAIQLVVEEGREIQRVKDLNVLGKSAGNHLLLRQPIPIFKSEKLV